MCYSISSAENRLIFRYQNISTQVKQHLTLKYDILQTRDRKGDCIKMTTVIKIGFTSAAQLAYPVGGQQGSLTHQLVAC